ncbi:MAG: alpha/beta hydrolase [Candidatus Promineifilaceae bacterium]
MNRKINIKRILLYAAIVLLAAITGFFIWAETPLQATSEAEAALQSDARVIITQDAWITFYPAQETSDTALILYPGGRVEAIAYAPPARAIAEQGYLVILPPMPLNFAFLNANVADDIIAAHPEIRHWVIGGHSLGGAMAANYVYNHPGAVDGLVLWASYPAENNDLTDRESLLVLSIYGTNDGQAAKLAAADDRLPPQTRWAVIEGGNHAQFGYYGRQSGDGEATISHEQQQEQIINATLALLHKVAEEQ